jgi:hypothetical protein
MKLVVSCESFDFEGKIQWICFNQVFSKACQYGTIDGKAYRNLKYVFISMHKKYALHDPKN